VSLLPAIDASLEDLRQIAVALDNLRGDGLASFSALAPLQQVRVLGEWHWVDSIDRQGHRLYLRPESGQRSFWYSPAPGERFPVEEPF